MSGQLVNYYVIGPIVISIELISKGSSYMMLSLVNRQSGFDRKYIKYIYSYYKFKLKKVEVCFNMDLITNTF